MSRLYCIVKEWRMVNLELGAQMWKWNNRHVMSVGQNLPSFITHLRSVEKRNASNQQPLTRDPRETLEEENRPFVTVRSCFCELHHICNQPISTRQNNSCQYTLYCYIALFCRNLGSHEKKNSEWNSFLRWLNTIWYIIVGCELLVTSYWGGT